MALESDRQDESGKPFIATKDGGTAPHKDPTPRALDGGWGYMVLLGTILSHINTGGMGRTHTLVYQQLYERFRRSATETAWVTAVHGTFRFAASPLASIFCNRFGARYTVIFGGMLVSGGIFASAFPPSLYYMYVTYGVLSGVGASFIITSCTIMVGQYFDKKRAKANGVMSMGGALGGASIAPLLTILYQDYGYSNTLIIQAGLLLHVFITAALFRPLRANQRKYIEMEVKKVEMDITKVELEVTKEDPNQTVSIKKSDNTLSAIETMEPLDDFGSTVSIASKNKNLDKSKPETESNTKHNKCSKYLDMTLLKNKGFMSYSFMMTCAFMCRSGSNTFLAGLAFERNISNSELAVIFVVAASVDFCSRFISGIIFDLQIIKKKRILAFSLCGIVFSGLMCIMPLTYNFPTFVAVIIFRSIFGSTFVSQHNTILCDIVGRDRLSSAVGLGRFFTSIGYLCGPAIGGAFRDWSGNYSYTFYFAGIASAVGIFGLILLNIKRIFTCTG